MINEDEPMYGYCENPSCKNVLTFKPRKCCDAFDCGCQGLPIDPPVCSTACYDALMNNPNDPEDKQEDE